MMSIERGDGNGGTTGSISGEEGFEREAIDARSVNECDKLRYVDDASPIAPDLGELSRDFWWSEEEPRLSDCSGVTRPAEAEGTGGGSCGVDLFERKRERKLDLEVEGGLPGEAGISCS